MAGDVVSPGATWAARWQSVRDATWRLVVSTVGTCFRNRVTGLAAEAAFFALLSLPPLVFGLAGFADAGGGHVDGGDHGDDHEQHGGRGRAKADVLEVDQLLAGWYGGAAVEAMMMGVPVIAYMREEDLGWVPADMARELPVVSATPDSLVAVA